MTTTLAVLGDVHGHLQLALCMAARWGRERGVRFDAVVLCGDVGTFTDAARLDNATRDHARTNACELEFLYQWAADEPPPWLEFIFREDGLGLDCPVLMVHGNHEGFDHLESLVRGRPPTEPVSFADLPAVDRLGRILLLPSGWKVHTPGGHVIAGIGGMEPGQRRAHYHPMAYIDPHAVEALLAGPPSDVLITHQGPAGLQGQIGSGMLQRLLDAQVARAWFHGHGVSDPTIRQVGRCTVVPLGGIAFGGRHATEPGLEGWSQITLKGEQVRVLREPPPFWRDYRRSKWTSSSRWGLICPDLVPFL